MWPVDKVSKMDASIKQMEQAVEYKRAESEAAEEELRAKLADTAKDLSAPFFIRLWKALNELGIEHRLDDLKGGR